MLSFLFVQRVSTNSCVLAEKLGQQQGATDAVCYAERLLPSPTATKRAVSILTILRNVLPVTCSLVPCTAASSAPEARDGLTDSQSGSLELKVRQTSCVYVLQHASGNTQRP